MKVPLNISSYRNTLHEVFFFILNLLCFILIVSWAFSRNVYEIFQGIDGAYMREIIRHQFIWDLSFSTGNSNNFFQSLGNVYFPMNVSIIPAFVLSYLLGGAEINNALTYTLFAVEIFIVIYVFCRYFRLSTNTALISGWLFVFLVYPLVGPTKIYGIMSLTPQLSTGIAQTLLLVMLIDMLRHKTKLRLLIIAAAICLIIAHIIIAYPAWIILTAPFVTVAGIYTTLRRGSVEEKLITFLVLSAICMLFYITGFAQYLFGLFGYTSATFFPGDVFASRAWSALSAATSLSFYGTLLVVLGLIGAMTEIFQKNLHRKNLADITLIYATILYTVGISVTYFQVFSGVLPAMVYLEFVLWPIYVIYTVMLVLKVLTLLSNMLVVRNQIPRLLSKNQRIILPLALMSFIGISASMHSYVEHSYPYPPKKSAMFDKLDNDLALQPGDAFKGRVATFYGLELDKASWFDIYRKCFDEDHVILSFQYLNIPTLFEYNPLAEPTSHMFMKKFLANPEDVQMRSVFLTRRMNPKILSLLGVKYALTDREVNEKATLVMSNTIKKSYLYEINDVNLGHYSPTNVHIAKDAQDALTQLSKDEFEPQKDVVLFGEITSKLVPAKNAKMFLGNMGILRVKAASEGHSILVLPLIYSNCIDLSAGDDVELFRADFFLTGIKFYGDLDVELRYFTGPLHNSTCRLQDIRDAKALDVKNVAHGAM